MKFTKKASFFKGVLGTILLLGIGTFGLKAQVSLTATSGTATGSFTNITQAFSAINAGTHQGSIVISVNANTTEPATSIALAASGQGSAVYTDILIKPTAVVTVSATPTTAAQAVLVLDGADNVTIDGSIASGGTTRDMTIQNLAANTLANTTVIRLIARTTLGLGCTNVQIKNNIIIGSTTGNNGSSGSTSTTSFGIFAGSNSTTAFSYTTSGADYDNCLIENNAISNCYNGIVVNGTTGVNTADNNVISKNHIGASNEANSISLRGIYVLHNTGTTISDNTVENMVVSSNVSPCAIEVAGSAASAVKVLRNKISKIHSTATGGYGAYGINIAAGANHIIANNVISDLKMATYSNTTTTFEAFGIRIAGGTGLGVYYNSINLYDIFTNGGNNTLSGAACLVVTSTAVTLTANNNIFNNAYAAASTMQRSAMWFPTSYNFLNATLNNNYYGISGAAGTFVGRVGTTATGLYADLNAWRAISQVNNASNDVDSRPNSNGLAPYTSNTNLVIPASSITPIESGGVVISALGTPNTDYLLVNRPAGSGTAPDMGAYEFEGSLGDFVAPVASNVVQTPAGSQCVTTARTVQATITDNVGVVSANINYTVGGVAQTAIAMSMISGTATNGVWQGTIPAAPTNNTEVAFSVSGTDATPNTSPAATGVKYRDASLTVDAGADQTINLGSSATLTASPTGVGSPIMFTEIIQFKTGVGQGTYPAYVTAEDNDYIEVTNISANPVDLNGWTVQLVGGLTGAYTFTSSAIVGAGQTAFFITGTAGTDSPANNLYKLSIGTGGSTSAIGYILKNPSGEIADAFASNSYVFLGPSGVSSSDWSGNTPSGSGACGFIRTAAADNNVAGDWIVTNASNLSTPNAVNTAYNAYVEPTYSWAPGGQTTKSITVTPTPSGTYKYYVTVNNGTCSYMDSVNVTVQPPVTPVANFSGTPLSIVAGANVTFTDASQNVPSSWAWAVSPNTGVSFVSSTSSSSQNPVIQFNNAGVYSITLTASNSAGSDDSTRTDYINVAFCGASATNTADTDIGNVTFAGINEGTATPVTNNSSATGLYTNNTAGAPAIVEKGGTYPISLSQITSGGTFYGAWFNVFIDWNGDGAFDPSAERVYTSSAATSLASPTQTANIVVPLGAKLGTVRMRVLLNETGSSTQAPCGNFTYGEVEDYSVNVICPTVASPTSSDQTICSGSTASFTATSPYGSASVIRWYDAMTGGTLLATGASFTTPVLTATTTYYVSDSISGCAASARAAYIANVNDVTVVINPVDVTCNGGSNGSFVVSDTLCGTAPFTYSIDNGAYGQIPTNLMAGTYSVRVKDVNNLTSAAYSVIISQPSYIVNVPSSGGNLEICQGETSAEISAVGSLSSTSPVADTFVIATNHLLTGSQTVTFPVNFTIPSNATVTSTSIVFSNVTTTGFNYPSDAYVSSTGDITLSSVVVAPVNSVVTNAGPYSNATSNAMAGVNNAVITLQNVYTGTMTSTISVIVNYNVPDSSDIRWFDVASGGASIGSGVELEAVGTALLPNTNTPGVYTFYAEGEYNTCISNGRIAVNVKVKANSTNTLSPTVCDSYTAPSGQVFTATGQYMDTIPNAVGCDSVFTINLTVKNSSSSSITASECSSYTGPNGTVYTQSGTYTEVIANAVGCDSVITLNVTILQPSSSTINASTCDLYVAPSGALYNQTGTYTDVIQNAAGCDSVITIHLTKLSATSSSISVSTCGEYTAPSGATYTNSGTYTDVIPNAAGCDSVITIQLTVTSINTAISQNGAILSANENQADFQWLDCNNNNAPIAGATNQIFIGDVNGSFAVQITKGTCIDTSDCVVINSIGLVENDAFNFHVVPNPTSGIVTVQFESTQTANLVVLDATGKVIMTLSNINNGQTIDLMNQERGMYMLRLETEVGTHIERVVKN